MHRSFPIVATLLLAPSLAPASARAQARVSVAEENFRATAGGAVLGTLSRGAPLVPGAARGRWRQATLEAWIWAPSTRPDPAGGHDLRVSARGGENLRSAPAGERIGLLLMGARLDRVEARGRWLRVRRTGWIWAASLRIDSAAAPPGGAGAAAAKADSAATPPAQGVGPPVVGGAAPAPDSAEATDSSDSAAAATFAGFVGAALTDRRGDTLAVVRPLSRLGVVERSGDSVRVRIEGWVPASDLTAVPASPGVLADEDFAALASQGDALRGRAVRWTLSFISLQRAAPPRSDFQPGEHFILARGPGELDRLVYVAVPARLLPHVRALAPLQSFTAFGRIRTPRSPQTGAPVIDLEALR